MNAPLIAVDWGSTNFRAKLVLDGIAIATVETADGIRNHSGREFDDILTDHCGAWKQEHPDAKIILSGMIGSREGWIEVPYVSTPAGTRDLAGALTTITSPGLGAISIVPGVRSESLENGTTDVMRGEETQIAGLLETFGLDDVTICLPGTHSKWIRCREGQIISFRTWLTGEAFDLLTRQSLISGTGLEADPQSDAFQRGLELSGGSGGMLHHLFLCRTEMLAGRIRSEEMRSIVSGILVGHEVREALLFTGPESRIILSGDSAAAKAVATALDGMGRDYLHEKEDAHLAGILAIVK
jgi:2-dehydro-3-deoxygalactonokinase